MQLLGIPRGVFPISPIYFYNELHTYYCVLSDCLRHIPRGKKRTFNVIVVLSSTYVVSFCDTYLNKSFFLDNNVSRPGRYFLCFKSLEPLGKLQEVICQVSISLQAVLTIYYSLRNLTPFKDGRQKHSQLFSYSSYILRRPQNFAKSLPIICPMY